MSHSGPRGLVPAPPPGVDLPTTVLPAGTHLYRVHDARHPATGFNPGQGQPSRFAFFPDPTGRPVPVLYAGQTPQAAVFESVFHDTVPGQVVHPRQWRSRVLSVLEVTRDLTVAQFHSAGLGRLDLYPRNLTDTPPTAYPQTVAWAQAAHAQGLAGCVWMSRQHNTDQAWVLFGDRVPPDGLREIGDHPARRVFALPVHESWLARQAEAVEVVLLLS